MVNPSSDSYRNPLRYTGQDYNFAAIYRRNRDPDSPTNASSDIRPKEQQGYYPISSLWSNSSNGNLWALANIYALNGKTVAHWILIGSTNDNPVLAFNVPNGTTPIVPNTVGAVTFTSTGGTVVITGSSAAPNNTNINFDITGGSNAIEKIAVDANTGPGTNPVLPTGGQLTITGGQVAAGTTTNAIRTDSLAANTFTVEIQRSQAVASTTIGVNGISHFSNGSFAVDANGFVTLKGDGLPAIQKIAVQTPGNGVSGAYTYTPATNMQYCIVELVAGGGGGGGVAITGATTAAAAGGGGGGGYSRRLLTASDIGASKVATIGAGGAGGAAGNNNGVAGGTSSLGALLSATGGGAGSGTAGSTVTSSTAPGAAGGTGSTGDMNLTGSNSGGGHVWFNAASFAFGLSGDGGGSFFGGITTGGSGNNDGAAGKQGSGGAGASANNSNGTGQAGGKGGDGFMIITEFCS